MNRPATAGAVLALLVALAPAAHADDTIGTLQPQQAQQPPAVPAPQTTPQPAASPVGSAPTPGLFRWTVFGPARRLAPPADLTPLHPAPAPVQHVGDPMGGVTGRTPLHPGLTAGRPAHSPVPGSPVGVVNRRSR